MLLSVFFRFGRIRRSDQCSVYILYCEIVRDIAAKPGDWLYYDEKFRFIGQSAPDQHPWDAIHWKLWLKAVTNFSSKTLPRSYSSQVRENARAIKEF